MQLSAADKEKKRERKKEAKLIPYLVNSLSNIDYLCSVSFYWPRQTRDGELTHLGNSVYRKRIYSDTGIFTRVSTRSWRFINDISKHADPVCFRSFCL